MLGPSAPLLRPYSRNPLDRIADGVVTVLLARGVEGFSMGAIGRAQRTSAQAFHQYVRGFRHPDESSVVATLHRIAANAIVGRWLEWDGGALRLPQTEEDRDAVVVWNAFHELARGRALAGDTTPVEILREGRVSEVEQCQGWFLACQAETVGHRDVELLIAVADGLRAQLARPRPSLSLDDARKVLDGQVAAATGSATRPAA